MRTCIYCLNELEDTGFSQEHVMPQAFGKFENNLTLHCVCGTCNQYFGDKLEVFFTRDSYEAVLRLRYGLKPARGVGDLRGNQITFRLEESGDWSGVRMGFRADGDKIASVPIPQVGLRRKGSPTWEYFTPEELADAAHPVPAEQIAPEGIRIIGTCDADRERLIALLASRGISFRKAGELPPYPHRAGDLVDLEYRCRIDAVVQRCIAKIAFNYMARMTSAEFARYPEFDATRSFIRFGTPTGYAIVDLKDDPILYYDSCTLRQTNGHLVTLNWSPDRRHIVGQVSLFNEFTYTVSLCRGFTGIWRPIRSGHHFDWAGRTINRLGRG